MTLVKRYIKESTESERVEFFEKEALRMWKIRDEGKKVNLPINFIALRREGLLKKHIKLIKKYFKISGEEVSNVTYYYLEDNERLEIFLEESSGGFDWKQNFMPFSFKTKIGGDYRRYHLGFFATAITVFKDLQYRGMLTKDKIIDLFGYSHGAGALPSFYSMLLHNSTSTVLDSIKKFEPPRDIYMPNRAVKKECEDHINFIQGIDVVTKVPWWMKSLGCKINIKGRPLPFFKGILRAVFDHDIYWTDPSKS